MCHSEPHKLNVCIWWCRRYGCLQSVVGSSTFLDLGSGISPGAEGGPVCNFMSPNFDS